MDEAAVAGPRRPQSIAGKQMRPSPIVHCCRALFRWLVRCFCWWQPTGLGEAKRDGEKIATTTSALGLDCIVWRRC